MFTHFPPGDSYNVTFQGAKLAKAVSNYAEKGRGTRSLAPFGHGDGGGEADSRDAREGQAAAR